MQELCGTRQLAASIEPHLASTVDASLVDALHDSSLVYVASQSEDQLTWVSVISRPASSSVPLVQVLGPSQVRVTGEISINDPLCETLRHPNAMVGMTVMQEWTRDHIRLKGRLTPSVRTTVTPQRRPPSAENEVEQQEQELKEHQHQPHLVHHSELAGVAVITFNLITALVMSLCPKYIVDRRITARRDPVSELHTTIESRSPSSPFPLPNTALQLLARTDTLWLGTTEPAWGSQSSHGGGMPGFIRISGQANSVLHRLEWADYTAFAVVQNKLQAGTR